MKQYTLRGLAEGLVGSSSIKARSVEDVFAQHPALAAVRSKLTVSGTTISGFSACDG